MIWDSCFWKDDLIKVAESLRKRKWQRRWSEVSCARVEQSVMIAFYSARKLIEAKKICDTLAERPVLLTKFQSKGKNVTRHNWHRLEELYQFDRPTKDRMNLRDLSNQFIHSYVFSLMHSEDGGLDSILFCSDRQRNRFLYKIEVDTLVEVFKAIGEDYPNLIESVWQADSKDYDVRCYTDRNVDPEVATEHG